MIISRLRALTMHAARFVGMNASGRQNGHSAQSPPDDAPVASGEEALPRLDLPAVWTALPDGFVDFCHRGWIQHQDLLRPSMSDGAWSILHPDDRKILLDAWIRAVESSSEYNAEVRLRISSSDHTHRWFLIHGVPIRDETARIQYWLCGHIEIETQKCTEKAMREGDQQLRTALDAAGIGVWEWTISTGRISWSPGLERIYEGVPFPGCFEATLDRIHPEDREAFRKAIADALDRGSHYQVQYRILLRQGGVRWIRSHGQVCPGSRSRLISVCLEMQNGDEVAYGASE